MHALHNIHTALAPDGILVDTQPVSARPPVAGDGVILGTLDMREWLDTIQAVDERFAETIGAGLYELQRESRFVVTDTYARSKFEDTRRKAQKFGARGTTVKAYKPRR